MANVERVTLSVVEPSKTPTGIPVDGVPDVSIQPTPVATARRQHGVAGAMLAAGMLSMEEAMGLRKKKEDAPIVIAAATDPLDIDEDGIDVPIEDRKSVV